jgi:hypothetical protein
MTAASTPAEVLALPAMPSLYPQAAAAVGVGRDLAYELHRRNEFPVEVIQVGRLLKVRRTDLLRFLGIEDTNDGAGAATPTPPAETHAPTNAS